MYCVSRQLNSRFHLLNCKIMILLFHNYDIKKEKKKKKGRDEWTLWFHQREEVVQKWQSKVWEDARSRSCTTHRTTLVKTILLFTTKFREPQMNNNKKQLRKWRIRGDFKFQDTYAAAIDEFFFFGGCSESSEISVYSLPNLMLNDIYVYRATLYIGLFYLSTCLLIRLWTLLFGL